MMKRAVMDQQDDRTIQDRAYDLLGDMLIERDTATFTKELEAEQVKGNTSQMDAFFAKTDQLNIIRINDYCKRQRNRRLWKHTLPRIGQVAAIVIAIISLAGSVAVATSPNIRVQVMKLLVRIDEEYTSLSLVEDESASFSVPAEWKGSSFLSYVPQAMVQGNISAFEGSNSIDYFDSISGKRVMTFLELSNASEANIDTEDATMMTVSLNGYVGFIAEKVDSSTVFWSDGLSYFVLSTHGVPTEEIMKIAQGVRKIK